jgi:RNA polymerase sigma-70 factor (ECF subfamily)
VRDDALAETMAPAESTDSEHLLEQQQGRLVLDQILDALPPELRTVFVLYELEQVDTYQIADLLLIARGTVVSRLRRAREIFEQRAERFRRNLPPK